MKRAKIMLSAIAVLVIVGGALAFKSNKAFNGNLRCTAFVQGLVTTNCPLMVYAGCLTGVKSLCTFTTAPRTGPCITTTVCLEP